MKTILYNPIFINPQAYYVFPRLTRYLQPDNESTSEPANYIGTIEVKVIAYGDTTLKRTYTNTDSIDLSEFKNTWIRISLFTKVGSCVLGEWKIGNVESDLPYIDPEVLASLKAVVIVGNKTNNDSDRAIVKNLVDPDNPFVISNAAYEGMSGYNGYPVVFGSNKTWETLSSVYSYTSDVTSTTIHITRVKNAGTGLLFSYVKKDGALTNIREIPAFRVTVKGLEGNSKFGYRYLATEDATGETLVYLGNGTHELSKSFTPTEALLDLTRNAWVGIFITPMVEGEVVFDCDITIEILPEYEGAFVTDGVNDMITSTKTVQEMLGGSNEITVVSLITHISGTGKYNIIGDGGIQVSDYSGQTFMAGTSSSGEKIVELGDKEKLQAVQYTTFDSKLTIGLEDSSYAYYGTFVFNKENVPVDWIHQVIAYFNLDRTLKPDILCDVKKQGITNENHAEFGDKLIDFSGNGRDIQLNNLAWDGDSGIGKYNYPNWKVTATIANTYSTIVNYPTVNGTYSINVNGVSELMQSIGLHLEIKYTTSTGIIYNDIKQDGVYSYILPDGATDLTLRFGGIPGIVNEPCNITITQIPSHAGALCLDGVNDFGKVTGMPVYKDYTFIIDYERISYTSEGWGGAIVSKSPSANNGAFISMMANSAGTNKQLFSFGGVTAFIKDDLSRILFWQTKYKSENTELTVGEGVDGDTLWLGTLRDNDSRFFNGAIYSLMSFPYSMSEFLIERQLKKHKLGTLYPDMVEWRPIIKSNVEYASISYLLRIPGQGTVTPVIGQYYPILSTDTSLVVYVATNGVDEVANLTINGQEPTSSSIHVDGRFKFEFPFNNSPQKINITIDEYIRYEDIVQPYPVLLRFNDENGNEVSWGGKFRVGSTITRIGSAADSNLLPNIYNIFGLLLNDNQVTSSKVIVEKTMVFKAKSAYIFDNNEPNCILSPRLLRIPNSSYKILGYIPDISGHGNHGKINNSAYAEGSGVNGYLVDFTTLKDDGIKGIVRTDSKIYLDKSFNYNQGFWLGRTNNPSPAYKVKVSGIPETGMLTYTGGVWLNLVNGINELPARTNTEEEHGFVIQSPNLDWSNLVIEQIGEYEGAYCLDGVDDFVTIPTIVGGKQMLMKVNWDKTIADAILYDQRGYPNEFAIYNADNDNSGNPVFAYQARNNGQTYIDGILNKNIKASELRAITHNITITNELQAGVNQSYAVIGSNRVNDAYFTKMALYDFMLFDEISTDDKIKELNEYVGIEGNT